MKKFILAVAVVLTAGMMASCNSGAGCYKYSVSLDGKEVATAYYYCNDADEAETHRKSIEDAQKYLGDGVKVTMSKDITKSKDDCTGGSVKI